MMSMSSVEYYQTRQQERGAPARRTRTTPTRIWTVMSTPHAHLMQHNATANNHNSHHAAHVTTAAASLHCKPMDNGNTTRACAKYCNAALPPRPLPLLLVQRVRILLAAGAASSAATAAVATTAVALSASAAEPARAHPKVVAARQAEQRHQVKRRARAPIRRALQGASV